MRWSREDQHIIVSDITSVMCVAALTSTHSPPSVRTAFGGSTTLRHLAMSMSDTFLEAYSVGVTSCEGQSVWTVGSGRVSFPLGAWTDVSKRSVKEMT